MLSSSCLCIFGFSLFASISWQFGSKLASGLEMLDQFTSSIFCILGSSQMYQGCICRKVDCVLKLGVDAAQAADHY